MPITVSINNNPLVPIPMRGSSVVHRHFIKRKGPFSQISINDLIPTINCNRIIIKIKSLSNWHPFMVLDFQTFNLRFYQNNTQYICIELVRLRFGSPAPSADGPDDKPRNVCSAWKLIRSATVPEKGRFINQCGPCPSYLNLSSKSVLTLKSV